MLISDKAQARLCVVLASVLSSSSGFFIQSPYFDTIPSEFQAVVAGFWRCVFAAILLHFMVPAAVRKGKFHPAMLLSGLCVFLLSLTFIASMRLTSSATAIWLQDVAPFWVFLASVVFLRAKMSYRQLIPLALAMTGVGILLGFSLQTSTAHPFGLARGVCSGIRFAGAFATLRFLRAYDSNLLVLWNMRIAMVCFLPLVLWAGYVPTVTQLGLFALFGIFQFALPYCLIARGLKHISAQEGTLITLLEPILAPVWVYLTWGISEPWWTFLGGSFVCVALFLRSVVWGAE